MSPSISPSISLSLRGYIPGFIGAALMIASSLMKCMLPLRIAALWASGFLVAQVAISRS